MMSSWSASCSPPAPTWSSPTPRSRQLHPVRPEALEALHGVDQILHGGDVCQPHVLEALREVAPVSAVRGSRDYGEWADELPLELTLEFAGARIHMVHILKSMTVDPAAAG